MKKILIIGLMTLLGMNLLSQTIPDLPAVRGVGSAEVRGDSIFYFGGSDSYTGTNRYAIVYKYDGNSWQEYTSMPDNDVWGISSAIKGDRAYIYGGYSNGTNKLRIFSFTDKTWEYAANSPNIGSSYGHTMECVKDSLYLFFNGYVFRYDISSNTWSQKETLNKGGSYLESTVYRDEIYVTGWSSSTFFKYNPAKNEWTQLADMPYFVTSGSIRCMNNLIYNVGGTAGFGGGTFSNVLVYDIAADQWRDTTLVLSDKRAYMADVLYKNNFYVIGGLGPDGKGVSKVELISAGAVTGSDKDHIISESFELFQNFPNPFDSYTSIRYAIPALRDNGYEGLHVTLKLYDVLGKEVATLVNDEKPAGTFEVGLDASILSPGIYFYRLQAGSYTATKILQCNK